MEKLKEALIQFTHSNPSLFPNDANNSYPLLIEQCFPKFFSDFQTPNHPPYAAMIYKAICGLNKKGGSSEESISEYIKKEFADLPWAHSTLLKHHLEKLCECKEIFMTDKQCYLFAGAEMESGKKSSGPSKKRKKQMGRLGSEGSNKSTRPYKKSKKSEKRVSGVQKTSDKERIGLRKRKRKYKLKSKRKSSKRMKKHAIKEETKLQLLDEANLKQHNEVNDDESHEQKQILEVKMRDIQIQEQNEAGQESGRDNSGCINLEQTQTKENPELLQLEESPDSYPTLHGNGKRVWTRSQLKAVSMKDALAARSELTESLGYANMPKEKPDIGEHLSNEKQAMEVITLKSTVDTEPQQLSRSPSLDKPLIEYIKPMSSKVIPRFPDDEPIAAPSSTEVQDLISSQQDQQTEKPMTPEKLKVKSQQSVKKLTPQFSDDEPTAAPSSTEVQDPSSSKQDQPTIKLPHDDKPMYKRRGRHPKPIKPEKPKVKSQQSANVLIPQFPNDEPAAAPSSTEVQDPISSQQDQQPEKLPFDNKPKYKRRGRPPKPMEPEKSKAKSQQSVKKGKVGNKKSKPKFKGHGRHKVTKRSSRKPSY